MDFDNRKVYGDTFITDGLVFNLNFHFFLFSIFFKQLCTSFVMKTMQAPIVKMIEATAVAKFEIPGHQIIQDVNGVRLRAS